ncbi:MAG: CRISPR-associated endonuclease Cas2 [Phycisphaerales bacterium]|nr:CRISPR-associated endonuclease Cas2 [Phycisphaerales bacterium]
MIVLITYDVATADKAGQRRLRRVARACVDYGVRVQKSVFECTVGDKEWAKLRDRLLFEVDPTQDSLRFYFIDAASAARTEHYGSKPPPDLSAPLIA